MASESVVPIASDGRENSRFTAMQIGDLIQLKGDIHDATNFFGLETLLDKPRAISLQGVGHSTWNGLRALITILVQKKCTTMIAVPAALFEELRIMPEIGEQIFIESFYCNFHSSELDQWDLTQRLVVNSELANIDFTAKDRPSVPLRHIDPQLAVLSDNLSLDHIGSFLYDYFAFSSTVLGMLVRQLNASTVAFRNVLSRLQLRLENLRECGRALGLEIHDESFEESGKSTIDFVGSCTD
jgi:hypothetical protein